MNLTFEVFTAVKMSILTFWVVTPRGPVGIRSLPTFRKNIRPPSSGQGLINSS